MCGACVLNNTGHTHTRITCERLSHIRTPIKFVLIQLYSFVFEKIKEMENEETLATWTKAGFTVVDLNSKLRSSSFLFCCCCILCAQKRQLLPMNKKETKLQSPKKKHNNTKKWMENQTKCLLNFQIMWIWIYSNYISSLRCLGVNTTRLRIIRLNLHSERDREIA